MILDQIKSNIEMSGEMDEKLFSISFEDQGMIFDILRNKLYSNPILAICREISCNARDAMREVGTPDKPIVIHLPSSLEAYYKIKDFGPGISPDRMENIFIKYGSSTKRESNVFTGAYGLGCKTPLSVSDSFSITTNYNGTSYNYICFIDETKVGKLLLANQQPTKEPNGTEIQIPALEKDFHLFADYTEQACRHWEVKPIIKGNRQIHWRNITSLLEGDNWKIIEGNSYSYAVKIIVDGIEYPLELDSLTKYTDAKLINKVRGDILMYCGTGEISLSASREQVYLDDKTKKLIKNKLEIIFSDVKDQITDKIKQATNLFEANCILFSTTKRLFHEPSILGNFKWQGKALSKNNYQPVECVVYHFNKQKPNRYRRYNSSGSGAEKIYRSVQKSITFDDKCVLFVNDLPLTEITNKHIKKAFDDDATLKSLQVIFPSDKCTLEELNKNYSLDLMMPRKISELTKVSKYKPRVSLGNRLIVFKFSYPDFNQVSYSAMEEDTNEKILCRLNKGYKNNGREAVLKNKQWATISKNHLKFLVSQFPKVSFYGVDIEIDEKRIKQEFEDMKDIETFVEEKLLLQNKDQLIESKYAVLNRYDLDSGIKQSLSKYKKLINDPNSLVLVRGELHQKLSELGYKNDGLIDIYEHFNGEIEDKEINLYLKNNPHLNIKEIEKEFKKKYPLLGFIDNYRLGEAVEHLVEYINLIDQQ